MPGFSAKTARASSRPETRGMTTSLITRSRSPRKLRKSSRPVSPSGATRTRKPQSSRKAAVASASAGLSSTRRMFPLRGRSARRRTGRGERDGLGCVGCDPECEARRASGKTMMKRVPLPSWLWTSMLAPHWRTMP